MAEVYQVSEFGPMSGSTGKRKKYKKLVLGAAVRAKLASTMLAPLLALGATGLITLAVVEESTMNVLQDPPPAYSWDDGGGQQQGNRPPAEKPKPPEKKPQASPSATPKTSPSPSPSTSPSPSPSPSPSTSPSPSPSAPVYYNDDSGDDEDDDSGDEGDADTYATVTQKAGKYRTYVDGYNCCEACVFCMVDPGKAESYILSLDSITYTNGVTRGGDDMTAGSGADTVRLFWNGEEEGPFELSYATVTLVSYYDGEVVDTQTFTVSMIADPSPTTSPW